MVPEYGLTISKRYSGAGQNVLGGYLAGLLLARLRGSGSVTLRTPIAVGGRVTLRTDEGPRLFDETGALVVEATPLGGLDVVPPKLGLDEATDGARHYRGLRGHLFPRCFCCGPARLAGDGLRIFPGPPRDTGAVVAAPWIPAGEFAARRSGRVPSEIVCSALDCPAIWALIAATDPGSDEKAVTGRLEIEIRAPVLVGQPYVVVGWPLGADGRKRYAGAAIEAADGSVVALARQTMIVTGNGVPLGSRQWMADGGATADVSSPGNVAVSRRA